MKNSSFLLIILLILFSLEGFSQRVVHRISDDHFEILIQSSESVPVRILQVTDLHLGTVGKWKDDLVSFNRIKSL